MSDWHTCDGTGAPTRTDTRAAWAPSRRGVLVGLGTGLLGWLAARPALAQLAIDPTRKDGHTLVVVFLRGGADGLSLVVPFADDDYHRHRPTLGLEEKQVIRLDDRFGLNPALKPLDGAFHEGRMAAVHACGSGDQTRSHFEAMETMERGVFRTEGPGSGWIARYLRATEGEGDSPLRALAFGATMPTSLTGATHAVALGSLGDFRLEAEKPMRETLRKLYSTGEDPVAHAGRETLQVLDALDRLDAASYRPGHEAQYPESDLGQGLKQVALLIQAGVGLEVACLDKGGWDTHVAQGVTEGWMPLLMDDLGKSLAAFDRDLGPKMKQVTVVVMSEFGRRIAENSGLGTDHGHGGVLFAMGGGVSGGRVLGDWPGLALDEGPGDLRVTTDYRDVLGEVLARQMRPVEIGKVFPTAPGRPVGLMA